MSMDANELARLRDVAEAATPGSWVRDIVHAVDERGGYIYSAVLAPGYQPTTGTVTAVAPELMHEDAEHIAAFDPPTALALLDEVERLTAQAGKATVETVNRLLGVNLWDARSFRADVRIDFDEYGAVLSAALAEPTSSEVQSESKLEVDNDGDPR